MLRILSPSDLEGYIKAGPKYELLIGQIIGVQKTAPDETVLLLEHEGVKARVYFRDRGSWESMLSSRILMCDNDKRPLTGSFISVLVYYKLEENGLIRVAKNFKFRGLWSFKGYKGVKNILVGHPSRIGDNVLKFEEYGNSKLYRRKAILPQGQFTKRYQYLCVCVCESEYIEKENVQLRESTLVSTACYTY